MIAVELVSDPVAKTPDAALTAAVAAACAREGVIVLTAGTYGNVLRFLPPLVIGEDLLTEGLDLVEKAFAAATSHHPSAPAPASEADAEDHPDSD